MYAELHARSAFSFLEGASLPENMAEICAHLDMPAMALTDRNGVYGCPRFHLSSKQAKIKAHIGAEVTCRQFSNADCKLPAAGEQHPAFQSKICNRQSAIPPQSSIENHESTIPFRLPLLASSRLGYQNLCRLITRMKLRNKKKEGEVFESELKEHAQGLICLTGGADGPLALALARGGAPEGLRTIERLMHIFGKENVYVELQRHFEREEEGRNRAAIEIAERLNLSLLATNGVCYATPRDRELADVFTSLRHHCTLATAGRLLARNSERFLKSPAQMKELFSDLPSAIANTLELSSRLEFTLDKLGYEFPRYPVPDGETMNSFLRERTREGFQRHYGRADSDLKQRARRQIERELKLIEKLDLAGYFLIVWDLVRFCREQNILVQGRGSAANSAVCYSLGITAVDPIRMELLFERFLSEERGEWPDIDLDLPSGDERERVIQYLYQCYGERGAAMTANVITYRSKSAAREMGKALGFDPDTLNKISAAVASWEFKDEHDALDRRMHDAGFDLSHPRLRKYFELCMAVRDLPRHLGQHSGGMVVCQGHLDSVVPLEPASMQDRVVVQWDKEDCADMGIVKIDLLGLGMMAVLKDSIELIHDHYKEEVELAHLPADDPAVYSTLQKADTVGMFQIESRAQMSCLPRLRPQRFYDIVVQVAIIRPGPIVGQMVNPFITRRQGREEVTYPHPSLEPVLSRTLGVPLFQEQLLRMAMVVANFTGGEAEELRRAMGFKRSQKRMKEIEARLRTGMEKNGIPKDAQEQIILSITSFALYGFPESHAASFALIAYASAFLKCHYLAAFTAALLNNQPMGFYHPATIVKDAQRHGLKVLPIDVTKSDWKCTLEPVVSDQSFGANPAVGPSSAVGNWSDCKLPLETRQDRVFQSAMQSTINPISWDDIGSLGRREELSIRSSQLPIESDTNYLHSTTENRQSPTGWALRLGLNYARGVREQAALSLVRERRLAPFESIHDLSRRIPELHKDELNTLAEIGALNSVGSGQWPVARNQADDQRPKTNCLKFHRRDALWQVERAIRFSGPLLEDLPVPDCPSPLQPMTQEERLVADFHGTGLTVGPHPMAYHRKSMNKLGVFRATDLRKLPNGKRTRIGGCVIARQRPGTAKGLMFLSIEDETGIANAIIMPDLLQKHRMLLVSENFLLIDGILQSRDNVIHVRAEHVAPLCITRAETTSHDFH
ncbi:MAG TPA: error-prone DNA polymerase [Terriglobales bacterium]|jgi:error-prone DNA polymerase|nr:error-prone DNA polymerase [Terriglobales bacterium]